MTPSAATFEITTDRAFIFKIVTNPKCWVAMKAFEYYDDPLYFFPPINEHFIWIKCNGVGLFMLNKQSDGVYSAHVCFLPTSWGQVSDLVQDFIKWGKEEFPFIHTVTVDIPKHNVLAQRIAHVAGFKDNKLEVQSCHQ